AAMPRGAIDRSFHGHRARRNEMSGRWGRKHFGAMQHPPYNQAKPGMKRWVASPSAVEAAPGRISASLSVAIAAAGRSDVVAHRRRGAAVHITLAGGGPEPLLGEA